MNNRTCCWRAIAVFTAALALNLPLPGRAHAGELEVFHYWDLAGDARAIGLLRSALTQQGHEWRDFTVAGGGNGQALALLTSRIGSGNPPAAAQMKAPAIESWARAGHLINLDEIARLQNWDTVLPAAIRPYMKYKGHYVAVPVEIHRNNWLWINSRILKSAGAKVPTTWDEFFQAAELIKRAGFTAVAHSDQSWEDLRLFESVVTSQAGAELYRKALVQLDPAALSDARIEQALHTLRRIKYYTDQSNRQKDWTDASDLLIRGQAGMQFMGDWNKPVLMNAQKASNFQFDCVPVPGITDAFVFDTDSFVLFKLSGQADSKAQRDFAGTILQPGIQEQFSLAKGSIPVRLGVSLRRYDRCAKASQAAYERAAKTNVLVPSLSMSLAPHVEKAMREIVSDFWRDGSVTPRQTINRLKALASRR